MSSSLFSAGSRELRARCGRKNRNVRLLSPCHAECGFPSVCWPPGQDGRSSPKPEWVLSAPFAPRPPHVLGSWGVRGMAVGEHRRAARGSLGSSSRCGWPCTEQARERRKERPACRAQKHTEVVSSLGGWGRAEDSLPRTVEQGRRLPGPVLMAPAGPEGAAWAGPRQRLVQSRGPGWPAAGSCWRGRRCWAALQGRHTRRRRRCRGPRCLQGVQCQLQPLCHHLRGDAFREQTGGGGRRLLTWVGVAGSRADVLQLRAGAQWEAVTAPAHPVDSHTDAGRQHNTCDRQRRA